MQSSQVCQLRSMSPLVCAVVWQWQWQHAEMGNRPPNFAFYPIPLFAAADPLSQQALEVQAQDLALEDALYALDKALNSNSVEPDVYLRQASCPTAMLLCCEPCVGMPSSNGAPGW